MARTETITRTLFSFAELDDSAKDRARDWFRGCEPWGWQEETWASARAFSTIAPIDIRSADYDRADVDCRWTGDEAVGELSGLRAWKWLHNNGWLAWAENEAKGSCTMTGYCADASFAGPIVALAHKPAAVPTLEQMFYECAQSWVQAARRDMGHAYSDEAIDESIEANEYEFDEAGNIA